MNKNDKIYVAGHNGLVGSEVLKELKRKGYSNLLTIDRKDLDLLNINDVKSFLEINKPKYVFMCAAKVGGIHANNIKRAEFLYENMTVQNNLIHHCYLTGVEKVLFLASSCIYPKLCGQPIKEEYLLTSELEQTNEPYAIAKISGIKMIESYNRQYGTKYISVMPTNLYGSENDNYDLETSHVFAAMIRKFHDAKMNNTDVNLWGDGSPKREFLHVNDLAQALIFLMNNFDENQILNIGTGVDVSIKELAHKISDAVGFKGTINWDSTKPNGTPRKLLDVSKINKLGWKSSVDLDDGIKMTYENYLKYHGN